MPFVIETRPLQGAYECGWIYCHAVLSVNGFIARFVLG